MQIKIIRDPALGDATGSFGAMYLDGVLFCATSELPWNNNLPGKSCIPVGSYDLIPYSSPAHGDTVCFQNTALGVYATEQGALAGARTYCEIHIANWPLQLLGCVGVGQQVLDIEDKGFGVTSSAATFAQLCQRWGNRQGLTAVIANA